MSIVFTKMNNQLLELLNKYDEIKGRFIYSPLISHWHEEISQMSFLQDLQKSLHNGMSLDLYVHIPFCKELCTFCGCNIKVTSQKEVANHFVQNLIKEWKGYSSLLPKEKIRSLTLGGGTPTFLEPETLHLLVNEIDPQHILWKQIEIDPRAVTVDHFKVLKNHLFNRVNIGIQDLDNTVMANVNRSQDEEQVKNVFEWAKSYGIKEVFVDLIFGLPGQSVQSIVASTQKLMSFKPDFINLYPLVNVPWLADTQKAYGQFSPIGTQEKWQLYLATRQILLENGFKALGFGHFIHPRSVSFEAISNHHVSRQLMGVLPFEPAPFLGLGPGSLSWSGHALKQNEKVTEKYLHLIQNGLPTQTKSHMQTKSELEQTLKYQNVFSQKMYFDNPQFADQGKLNEIGIELMKVIASEI